MNDAVHYTIVRYRPLPELSEFANIGVVALDSRTGLITHKLAPRRFRRITQFFDYVEPGTYSELIKILDHQLCRLSQLSAIRSSETGRQLFSSFVERREGMVTFSPIRAMSRDNNHEPISKLYDRFVRRSPEMLEQREASMVKSIRQKLHEANIFAFKARQIEDDLMPIRLPLVSDSGRMSVIKPVAFDQKTTMGVIDHANVWRDRFIYLLGKGILNSSNILLTIDPPSANADALMLEAFSLARAKLMELETEVLEVGDLGQIPDKVVEFAQSTGHYPGRLWH